MTRCVCFWVVAAVDLPWVFYGSGGGGGDGGMDEGGSRARCEQMEN